MLLFCSMKNDYYVEIEELPEEDKFKKIEFSSDYTDAMSDFLDK